MNPFDTVRYSLRTRAELVKEIARLRAEIATLEARLRTDSLTGLLNRDGLYTEIDQRIARRNKIVLMFLDLNNFKRVNDKHGHSAGDLLLMQVAERLRAWADTMGGVAARLNGKGDEFAILLTVGKRALINETIGEDAARAIAVPPIGLAGYDACLAVRATVGVTWTDWDESRNDLLRRADDAMYRARDIGVTAVCLRPDDNWRPRPEDRPGDGERLRDLARYVRDEVPEC